MARSAVEIFVVAVVGRVLTLIVDNGLFRFSDRRRRDSFGNFRVVRFGLFGSALGTNLVHF